MIGINKIGSEDLLQIDRNFFKSLSEFSHLLNQFECKNSPFGNDQVVERYLGLPLERRIEISERFESYKSVCESIVESGQSLRDSTVFLWKMLSRLKMRPGPDLFDKLKNDDIIEIYDSNSVQIFRNLRFFEICSYSLLEVFTYELWELYRRDTDVTKALIDTVSKVFTNQTQGAVPAGVPDHVVEEIFSESKCRYYIRQKYISPLFDGAHKPVAVCGNFSVLKEISSH
ncbi:MAG: hypothetical protein IT289_04730 [Oligoflexia bacterium]|nr:hypothetical protein [Oligoflexia bacterium]